MQLRYVQSLKEKGNMEHGKFPKISAITWSPNNMRLAVATADRTIILFDEFGEKKDVIPTKPREKKTNRNYTIRAMAFSPDSTRLAVGQSDNIVFVFKLGKRWDDKKTICNKFPVDSAVTSLCWPLQRFGEIVFGLQDGTVKVGLVRTHKTAVVYETESYVVSMAPGLDGRSFLTGHMDGSIYKYVFPDETTQRVQLLVCQVDFVPYALAWGDNVVVSGNTSRVEVYEAKSRSPMLQQFDYTDDDRVKDFTVGSMNPSGQTCVLGNFNRFHTYVYNIGKDAWEQASISEVENLYSVTALQWKSDGSKLITGSLCGAVDLYDACIRRYIYGGQFEFVYTSLSSVLIKAIETGAKTSIKSRLGLEIKKINIYQDVYLIASTPETLICCDLSTNQVSEVLWKKNDKEKEKYFFDNDGAVVVFKGGELSVIEYGKNDPLDAVRTHYMSPHLISVRIGESKGQEIKKMSFLLDEKNIIVKDMRSQREKVISHDTKIDWLELSQDASRVLFRDKRRALHVYYVEQEIRKSLLPFCTWVQWVPQSDVVVAQSHRSLYVWYNVDRPDEKQVIPINGDVDEIERREGKTEVIVDEGVDQVAYPLDDGLISFGAAIDKRDFGKAVAILERLGESKSGNAMWRSLQELALREGQYIIAERCASALGDISVAMALNNVNRCMAEHNMDPNHFEVRAEIAILQGQFADAEDQYVGINEIDKAIDMYISLYKWDEAINVADRENSPRLMDLRKEYFEYLLRTKQIELAGELKEKEHDYNTALQIYLDGGYPGRAAELVRNQNMTHDSALCDEVAEALLKSRRYEKAGIFLEFLRLNQRALDAYKKGNCFARALKIASKYYKNLVVPLEREWADYLAQQGQMDAACNHYIQANCHIDAINAAIAASQYVKASQILSNIDQNEARPYYFQLAEHYAANREFSEAEQYYLQANAAQDAITMYTEAGKWEEGHRLAMEHMSGEEANAIYEERAKDLEDDGRLKEAEKLYVAIKLYSRAVEMYKRRDLYDDMIRLIEKYQSSELKEELLRLAHQCYTQSKFKLAEQYYVKAKEWKPAADMYRENSMWEDCLRVSQAHGGKLAYRQAAYDYAVSLGIAGEGWKVLSSRGLGAEAVDVAIDNGEYKEAFQIAEKCAKEKIPEIHLQFAMALEDDGEYDKACKEFISAKKPKEAIDMYTHHGNWEAAMRVATEHAPGSVEDIINARANAARNNRDFAMVEQIYMEANKPEKAIQVLREEGQYEDAIRIAERHVPRMTAQLQQEKMTSAAQLRRKEPERQFNKPMRMDNSPMSNSNNQQGNSIDVLLSQAKAYENRGDWDNAIDSYLKIDRSHTSDGDQLERIWASAVSIAADYRDDRYPSIVEEVAARLVELKMFDAAAELYVGLDEYGKAVRILMEGKNFEKARSWARQFVPRMVKEVEAAQEDYRDPHSAKTQSMGFGGGNYDDEDNGGGLATDSNMEQYIQRGDWTKVYELAERQGPQVTQRYITYHVRQLSEKKDYVGAMAVLAERGVPANPSNFPLYFNIVRYALQFNDRVDMKKVRAKVTDETTQRKKLMEIYGNLRKFLHQLVSKLYETDPSGNQTREFEKFLYIAHFAAMRETCGVYGLKELFAKASVSLIRYIRDIPADMAFYNAGNACAEAKLSNLSFVFMNRFVDVCDWIEEPDGDLDNTDFLETDIPSSADISAPKEFWVDDDSREEAREWVIDQALGDDSMSQQLPERRCESCDVMTYEAGLRCHNCGNAPPPCVVTGYPVMSSTEVACRNCKKPANRSDWNKYVMKLKKCPWCESLQEPIYA